MLSVLVKQDDDPLLCIFTIVAKLMVPHCGNAPKMGNSGTLFVIISQVMALFHFLPHCHHFYEYPSLGFWGGSLGDPFHGPMVDVDKDETRSPSSSKKAQGSSRVLPRCSTWSATLRTLSHTREPLPIESFTT